MKKILVTGGAGFIGSHTCLALLKENYEIFILDSFVNSSEIVLKNINLVRNLLNKKEIPKINFKKQDLRDKEQLNNIFLKEIKTGNPISGVIHFAGLKSVEDTISIPLDYWNNNLIGTINLLEVMDSNNCHKIVFSSSATIYGLSENEQLIESSKLKPSNPYGESKLAIEKLLNNLFSSSPEKWNIIKLRYFNPIGAHYSGLIGESPIGKPNNIFPRILEVAIGKDKIIEIFGNDWPTNDGTNIRDYVHIMDIADGHVLSMEYLFNNQSVNLNLNLGTGKGTSVLELIRTFEKVNNIKINYCFSERRKGDVVRLVADNNLATKVLGWKPKNSLYQMCLDGWEWKKKYPNGYD